MGLTRFDDDTLAREARERLLEELDRKLRERLEQQRGEGSTTPECDVYGENRAAASACEKLRAE